MISFITRHIIREIEKITVSMKYDDYYLFDIPIIHVKNGKSEIIDRVTQYGIYYEDKLQSLYYLENKSLAELYVKLKNNKGTLLKVQRIGTF